MFSTNEFGAAPWLTYAILGFLLCIGYLVWRGMQAKKKSRAEQWQPRKRNPLEEELQAEINRAQAEAKAAREAEQNEALDLSAEERERLDDVRRLVERSGKDEG